MAIKICVVSLTSTYFVSLLEQTPSGLEVVAKTLLEEVGSGNADIDEDVSCGSTTHTHVSITRGSEPKRETERCRVGINGELGVRKKEAEAKPTEEVIKASAYRKIATTACPSS